MQTQLDVWIMEYGQKAPREQDFVLMRDLIYKIEQLYQEEYEDENGKTLTRLLKDGETRIKRLKASHKATKEHNDICLQKYLSTYELKKTHLPILEELGYNKDALLDMYHQQKTTWAMRWEQYKWRWEVYNKGTKEWEICEWKQTRNPSRETVINAWMEAKSQSDIGRKFNWTEGQVNSSNIAINKWLAAVGLPHLPEIPKYNNEELERRRIDKLQNTPTNPETKQQEIDRIRALLLKKGIKIMGTTTK